MVEVSIVLEWVAIFLLPLWQGLSCCLSPPVPSLPATPVQASHWSIVTSILISVGLKTEFLPWEEAKVLPHLLSEHLLSREMNSDFCKPHGGVCAPEGETEANSELRPWSCWLACLSWRPAKNELDYNSGILQFSSFRSRDSSGVMCYSSRAFFYLLVIPNSSCLP